MYPGYSEQEAYASYYNMPISEIKKLPLDEFNKLPKYLREYLTHLVNSHSNQKAMAAFCDQEEPISYNEDEQSNLLTDTFKEKETSSFQSNERVNHPSHYTWIKDICGVEVIDIAKHFDFCLGNALKYIFRAGHKTEVGISNLEKTIEDLEKAIFYINEKIKFLRNE